MEDVSQVQIKLAAVLSEYKGIFWRSEQIDKNMTVQKLIESRLPDMSHFDSENVHALRMQTNTILDKEKRIGCCGIESGEKIKIIVLNKDEAEKPKPKPKPKPKWRPTHPGCKFTV